MRKVHPFALIWLFCLIVPNLNGADNRAFVFDLDPHRDNQNQLNRSLTVSAGIGSSDSIMPIMTIEAWDGECRFDVDLGRGRHDRYMRSVSGYHNKILDLANDFNLVYRIYKRPDSNLEWEIVFNRKPDSNRLSFPIEIDNLTLVLQDTALVSSELKKNSEFPDSTIYAWIAYHSHNRDNITVIDSSGKITRYRYGTGIAFTIYRPRVFDANGWESWCRLDIDTVGKSMALIIPKEFLDKAAYPVTVDPTIGNSTAGSWAAYPSNWLLQAQYSTHANPISNGTLSLAYIYSYRANPAYACSLRTYVYDYSTDLSDCNLIASSDSISVENSSLAWNELSFNGQDLTVSDEYFPAFVSFTEGGASLRVAYGLGIYGDNRRVSVSDWTAPSDLVGASSSSEAWSCYFEYTVQADNIFPRRRLINQLTNRRCQ